MNLAAYVLIKPLKIQSWITDKLWVYSFSSFLKVYLINKFKLKLKINIQTSPLALKKTFEILFNTLKIFQKYLEELKNQKELLLSR